MRSALATFLLVAAVVPHAHAQTDDSNGFDMGQAYRNQTPQPYSDETSTFPVEGTSQGRTNPYPKYQFKNAGASKIIVPELGTGAPQTVSDPAVEATTELNSAPDTKAETTEPLNSAAASGDAHYYQDIISKVKAQGETKATTTKDQSKIDEYRF